MGSAASNHVNPVNYVSKKTVASFLFWTHHLQDSQDWGIASRRGGWLGIWMAVFGRAVSMRPPQRFGGQDGDPPHQIMLILLIMFLKNRCDVFVLDTSFTGFTGLGNCLARSRPLRVVATHGEATKPSASESRESAENAEDVCPQRFYG